MKYFSILMLLLLARGASAQWKDASFINPGRIGQFDTDVFCSDASEGKLWRHNPSDPYTSQFSWRGTSGIFGGDPILSFFNLGPYAFVGTTQGNIYRSSNAGEDWGTVGQALPFLPAITGFAFIDSSLFISTGGVWKSTDSGIHWTESDAGVANKTCLALRRLGNDLFVATNNGVYRSTDGGNNWTSSYTPGGAATGLAIAGTDIFAIAGPGVIRSTNSGQSWEQVNSGLTPNYVNTLASDGTNLFAATNGRGVYFSSNAGESWDSSNTGLMRDGVNNYEVTTIGVFDSTLFAASTEDGIGFLKMRPISEMVQKSAVEDQPQPSPLTISVYPNPATGLVTIRSGGTSILGITVLNVLGEKALSISSSHSSEISLDLSKLPSGTYFLRIETPKGSVLRKVIRE